MYGMIRVIARERADAVRAEEFVLVQHAREDAAQPLRIDEGEDAAVRRTPRWSGPVGWMLSRSSGMRSQTLMQHVRQLAALARAARAR